MSSRFTIQSAERPIGPNAFLVGAFSQTRKPVKSADQMSLPGIESTRNESEKVENLRKRGSCMHQSMIREDCNRD